jgi:tetratricopeptide (TPR) repeat protein
MRQFWRFFMGMGEGDHPWLMLRIKEAAVWAEETMPSFLEPFQEVEASPKALTKKLSHAKAYNNRGNARMAAGNKEGALSDYNQALALDSNYAPAFYNRGLYRYQLSQREEALSDYNRVIALDSTYAPAYYNRGNVRAHLGELEGAIADFQKAAELYRKQGNEDGYKGALERIDKLREERT